ncbi:anti-sigma factor [Nitriliruptoraceae bacterium ZYF776]|nr:anti-sigma factor [Profundirhabdus halotolerans]
MSSANPGDSRPDVHTLTGAYAVDALSDDERALFEEHLAVCDACAQEVAELQATAARLGAAEVVAAPDRLRDAVFAELDHVRQDPPAPRARPAVPDLPRLPARTWWTNLAIPAAAVVAIAVLGLAAIVANLNARLDSVEANANQMSEVLAAADAQTFTVDGEGGELVRVVASPSRGEAVFVVNGMEAAPADHVYELWMIDEAGATKAGLFDVDDRGRATRVLTGDMRDVAAIGVTIEPAGGSDQPTSEPIMVVPLES